MFQGVLPLIDDESPITKNVFSEVIQSKPSNLSDYLKAYREPDYLKVSSSFLKVSSSFDYLKV